jgi:hypothetical protein
VPTEQRPHSGHRTDDAATGGRHDESRSRRHGRSLAGDRAPLKLHHPQPEQAYDSRAC